MQQVMTETPRLDLRPPMTDLEFLTKENKLLQQQIDMIQLPDFSMATAEKAAIVRALVDSKGNKRKTARVLGIGKTTLYRKMRLFGIGEFRRVSV